MIPTQHRPPRRRLSGRPFVRLSTAVLLSAAAGCSAANSAPSVAIPSPPPREAKLCRALHDDLPETVGGLSRKDPRPSSELTAGWGDHAIVLRCGVPRPPEMRDPKSVALDADGVNWMVVKRDSGARFTTTYRETYVEVTLGGKFAGDATPLAALAASVKKAIPAEV